MRKIMGKRFLFIAFFMCLLMGASAPVSAKVILSVGTHPIGSFFNSVGTAVAKVVTDNSDVRVVVKPMKGPVAWLPFMARGEVDMGVLNMWDAQKSYLGASVYKKLSGDKGFSVRLLAISVNNLTSLVVAKESGITKLSQLKGKKVCGQFPTPSLQYLTEATLANGGLTWGDITPVPINSVSEGVKMVMEGRADASGIIAVGMPIIAELNAKKGARILLMDGSPEGVARYRKYFPGYPVKIKPSPTRVGIEKEGYLFAYDIYVICRKNLKDDEAYQIVKTLWDKQKELGKVHKRLVNWKHSDFVTKEALVPYHPGAVKFYKEVGVWTPEMQKLQDKLLAEKKK